GRVASDMREPDVAHEHLFRSFSESLALGDDLVAGRAAAALITSSDSLERSEGAERWFEISIALAKRLGDDPAVRATALTNYANHMRSKGESARARDLHAQARDAYALSHGEGSMRVADALYNQAAAAYDLGEYADAAAQARRALEIWRSKVGESHPRVLQARGAMAIFQLRAGEGEAALESQG